MLTYTGEGCDRRTGASGMKDIIDDFLAECADLDGLLSTLTSEQWLTNTPAQGWDIRDTVTHLAASNDLALECVRTGRSSLIDDVLAAGSFSDFEREHLAPGRTMPGQHVRAWWLRSARALADALLTTQPSHRIAWGPVVMGARSFTTARLMETWAHGLDCFAAVGRTPIDSSRLRHVAYLAHLALPYAFAVRGLPAPGPVRLVLEAPNGTTWTIGPDDAPSSVVGRAADWCRAAVNRDHYGERLRLTGVGQDGEAVITHVQAYLFA